MIVEPVSRSFILAILRALSAVNPKWRSREDVWESFYKWSHSRSRPIPETLEAQRLVYHQLQDLIEFALETYPSQENGGILRLSGRYFGEVILRERIGELLEATLRFKDDIPTVIELLFHRFMGQYAPYMFRFRTERSDRRVRLLLEYADPQATTAYLRSHGKDPDTCFYRNIYIIAATVEVCLEYMIEPWKEKLFSAKPEAGTFQVDVPKDAYFNYAKFARSLTEYAHQIQREHQEKLLARDLEFDLLLKSTPMRAQWERIRTASGSEEIILLRGEPGTGKTHLAKRVHEMSSRKGRPYIEVSLTADIGTDNFIQSQIFGHVKGAFTSATEDKAGLFTEANKGTIFLDEIGDATLDLQGKLLRVIERKVFRPLGGTRDIKVDVRILAATNRNLEEMVERGTFREDLYHRLNVIQFELPPLRKRGNDLGLLASHFLARVSMEMGKPLKPFSTEVRGILTSYTWPGNIRELIHVLKHALLFSLGDAIAVEDLPKPVVEAAGREPASDGGVALSEDETYPLIDAARLSRFLRESDVTVVPNGKTSEFPWHIDYAKKIYLSALILHCRGNLQKMTAYWDKSSTHTLRALIKAFGLWEELDRVRSGKQRPPE